MKIKALPKASQGFSLSYVRGQIVPQNSPAVAEAISIVIGLWQGNSKLIFRISKVVGIKYIAAGNMLQVIKRKAIQRFIHHHSLSD